MKYQDVFDRLTELVRISGLPAREVERLAGIAENTISGWRLRLEKNENAKIAIDTLTAYASLFGDTSLDWLVSGIGQRPSNKDILAAVEARRAHVGEAVAHERGTAA